MENAQQMSGDVLKHGRPSLCYGQSRAIIVESGVLDLIELNIEKGCATNKE